MSPRTYPIIFIPSEGQNKTLREVLLEPYQNFEILWYHWPRDGFLFVDDYEPVILVYSDDELCCLATRIEWRYQISQASQLHFPIEIVFGGPFNGIFHHPFARHHNHTDFNAYLKGKVNRIYSPTSISNPGQIPQKFRNGRNHPTALGRRVADPQVMAQEILSEYCGH